MSNITQLDVRAGSNVTNVIREALGLIQNGENLVVFTFNGLDITVSENDTAESVYQQWNRKRESKYQAHRKSPEYAEQQRQAENHRRALQAQADGLMLLLPSLDFSDYEMVLAWFVAIEDARDTIGVTVDFNKISETLRANGYEANAYTGDAFVESDKEIYARYIIGQGLVAGNAPLVGMFAERYAKAFYGNEKQIGNRAKQLTA